MYILFEFAPIIPASLFAVPSYNSESYVGKSIHPEQRPHKDIYFKNWQLMYVSMLYTITLYRKHSDS